MENNRQPDYPIERLFTERWSPRAFNEDSISEQELMTMLEAARWAPSAYNSQPWRFVYGIRGSQEFNALMDGLVDSNRVWAKNAAAVVFIVSSPYMRRWNSDEDVVSRSHTFDTGTAFGFLTIQAMKMGWYTHGMVGLDYEKCAAIVALPTDFRIEAAFVVGHRGEKKNLPEMFQPHEQPNDRRPLRESVFKGSFNDFQD